MRKCKNCQVEKLEKEFSKDRTKIDGLSSRCRPCQREMSKKHYRNNKEKYLETQRRLRNRGRDFVWSIKSKAVCQDCGFDDPNCLEFDHISNDKLFNISRACGKKTTNEKIALEIAKCEIVCANCHRKRSLQRAGQYRMVGPSGSAPA